MQVVLRTPLEGGKPGVCYALAGCRPICRNKGVFCVALNLATDVVADVIGCVERLRLLDKVAVDARTILQLIT